MKHAIYILFSYHFIVRVLTNYLNGDNLYYFLDALLIGVLGVFVYMKSEHSARNLAALIGVLLLALCQMINTAVTMANSDNHIEYLPELLTVFIAIDLIALAYNNRKEIKRWLKDLY